LVNQFKLLLKRRLLPLFLTQFFSAFNDSFFKNSIVVLLTFVPGYKLGFANQVLVTIAFLLLTLPMLLFSALAGNLADKFEKRRLVIITQILEIGMVLIACLSLYIRNTYLTFFALFLIGVKATFFGPLKYCLLPIHLKKQELIAANGLIEMGTFIAVLLGDIFGASLILLDNGLEITAFLLISMAVTGILSSLFIPKATGDPNLPIEWNIITSTKESVKLVCRNKTNLELTMSVGWFWLVAAVCLSQLANFTKLVLHGSPQVYVFLLCLISTGIAFGSMSCNLITKGKLTRKFVIPSMLVGSLCLIDIFFASGAVNTSNIAITAISDFTGNWQLCRTLIDFVILAISLGIYVVPLFSELQAYGKRTHIARIIAANNIFHSTFIVTGLLIATIILWQGASPSKVYLMLGVTQLIICIKFRKILSKRS